MRATFPLLLLGLLVSASAVMASPEATRLRNEPSFEDAIVRLDAEVKRAPKDAAPRGALAYAHARLSHRTIARVTAEEALDLDKRQPLAHLALGIVGAPDKTSSCTPEPGSKQKHLQQAIARDSTLEEAWFRLAGEYDERKDLAAAQQCRRRAVELGYWSAAALDYGRSLLGDVPEGAILTTTGEVADLCIALQAMGTKAEVPVIDVTQLPDKSYRERLASRRTVPLLSGKVWEPSWDGKGEPPRPWMNQVEAWLAPQNAAEARRVVTPCAAPAFDHRLQVQPTRHTATWEYVSASPPDTAGLAAVRMLADSLRSQPPAGLFRDPARSQQENWVHVEELPDAQLRVAPEYPSDARKKGVEGTVMVQALVAKNGHVEDACIAKSIPDLDKAALRAVIHWEFKPAKSGGQPIAVWVAVPVKFSLR